MGRFAERVHSDPAEIARIEALVVELDDEARIELELDDGSRVAGVVSVRPTVQVFVDPEGREGINALVRVDDALEPSRAHAIWLDRIVRVRRLGSA